MTTFKNFETENKGISTKNMGLTVCCGKIWIHDVTKQNQNKNKRKSLPLTLYKGLFTMALITTINLK